MLLKSHAAPRIVTPLPGPKAREIIASDEQFTSPSYTRIYPLVAEQAQGATITDPDGNVFLDFTAGIAVCSTGHCHPRVVKAVQQQAERLLHMSGTDFYYRPQRDLAKKLAELAPGEDAKRVFFANSGAEAIEAAVKLARYHTGRQHILAFFGAFHGRTMGALSLTGSKVAQRRGFEPLVPQVSHVDFAYCYRCPRAAEQQGCCLRSLEQIDELLRRTVPPENVAAIVVEPIQGEGGYIVPPPDFHPRLRALADRHGMLLIADEVQSGMGRTGKMFAMEHWAVQPDIICLAKGIASGMPLGAMIARRDVMDWPPGAHASTFGGNPISCVAALETIALLEEGLVTNAAEVGTYLIEQLQQLAQRHPLIGDVRGRGLMVGIELLRGAEDRRAAAELRDRLIQACFHQGLLLLGCGESTVRFCPPLIITRDDVDTALQIVERCLETLETEAQVARQSKIIS